MHNEFAVAAHWKRGFEEAGLQSWAEQLRDGLRAPRVSFGLVFMSPAFFSQASQVLEILRVHSQIPLLVGCSTAALIAARQEIEDRAGLVLRLFAFPRDALRSVQF